MLLLDILTLRDAAYRHAISSARAPLVMFSFIVLTGALYGILVSVTQQRFDIQIQGLRAAEISPLILFSGNILSGILMTLFFHGGMTLLVWFSARGMGGRGKLADLYRCTAYLLPIACLALPQLTLRSILGTGAIPDGFGWAVRAYPLFGYISALLLIAGLYKIFSVSQDFGTRRAIGSVAILTLFSVTALSYIN